MGSNPTGPKFILNDACLKPKTRLKVALLNPLSLVVERYMLCSPYIEDISFSIVLIPLFSSAHPFTFGDLPYSEAKETKGHRFNTPFFTLRLSYFLYVPVLPKEVKYAHHRREPEA